MVMLKTIYLILGFALLASIFLPEKTSAQWRSPWIGQPDVNLYRLIADGYEIVSAETDVVINRIVERVYLKKGQSVYRCITIEEQNTPSDHSCEMLANPARSQSQR